MTHPYDDFEEYFSDLWGNLVDQAADELTEWMERLASDACPSSFFQAQHEDATYEALAGAEADLLEALLKRIRDDQRKATRDPHLELFNFVKGNKREQH